MKYQFKVLLIVVNLIVSLSALASTELSPQEESFISYAAEGNLAQLQRVNAREVAPEVRFMAVMESIRAGKKKTTSHLLASAPFQEMELQLLLRMAASQGQVNEVEILLASGARVDGLASGETALMTAAREGKDAVVKVLLAKGARPDLVSQNTGHTAYGLAELHGRSSTLKIRGLRPIPVRHSFSHSAVHNAIPYVVSAVALLAGYLYVRGMRAVQASTAAIPAARRYHGQGLALRLAPDPRSAVEREAVAPREPVATPVALQPAEQAVLAQIMRMMRRLPGPLGFIIHGAVSHAMMLAEPFRAQALATIYQRTAFLIQMEISGMLARAQERGKELLAQAIAAAVTRLLQSPMRHAAPAA